MRSDSGEATLFESDPAAYLPHRDPFLFLDRIMFGNQLHFPPDEELDAELGSAPAV